MKSHISWSRINRRFSPSGKSGFALGAIIAALLLGAFAVEMFPPGLAYRLANKGEAKPASSAIGAVAIVAAEPTTTNSRQQTTPDGQIIGTPWTGEAGVSETTAEIMKRDPLHQRRVREIDPAPKRIRPNRDNLPQNPDAIPDSQWPVKPEHDAREGARDIQVGEAQTLGTSFTAATLAETSSFPPDTMGDVGPTQYVCAVNGRIKVFDKATGAVGALNADMDVFFQSVRNGVFTSDPRVRFDRHSGRWIVIIINVSSTDNRILVAVSNNATITAGTVWTFFFFANSAATPAGDTGCFADYPSLGIDANALYIGVNNFCPNTFGGTTAFVVRKSSVLAAGPIVVTAFRNLTGAPGGPGIYTPQGVDNFDQAATEGYFIGPDNVSFGTLVLRRVSNPGGTPTMSPNIFMPVLATSFPRTVPHLGNTVTATGNLDALDDRLFAAQIRNGRLWTAHNINVNNTGTTDTPRTRNAARWYEIKDINTATPSLVQAGTMFAQTAANSLDDRNYWIPSVNVSGQGHAALGVSAAGTAEYINAATAGRLSGDPLGSLRAPQLFTNSATAYNPASNTGSGRGYRRWGDYSYTSVDPVDDMTMWTIQQFCDATNSYGVRVVKLIAPPPAVLAGVNPPSVAAGQASANITVTGLQTNGAGFFDPGAGFTGRLRASISGGGSGGVTVSSVTYVNPTTITLNISTAGAAAGTKNITITNPDGQTATGGSVLTVGQCSYAAAPTTQNIVAGGGTGTITITTTAECGWTAASNAPWIAINSGSPGTGNGTVNYTVAANVASAVRTGTITAAGQTVTITQAAGPGCTYTLDPASRSISFNGGSGSFSVAAAAECAWTATTTDSFIRIITAGSGAGAGTVNYTVAASDSPVERIGKITVGNTAFTLTQEAAPLELAVDDGTFETGFRFGTAGNVFGVNRLTPQSYPATIKEVALYFRTASALRVGDPITILVGTNADGDDNINGTTFQTVSATVQRLDDFNVITVPNVTINSGDFVVGLRMPVSTTVFPYAYDTTTPRRRSYYSLDGTTFPLFDTFAPTAGNFSFRARLVRPPKLLLAAGSQLTEESCRVANNAIDPGEKVTVSFALRNQGTESTTNLTATLQTAGGVTMPDGPQSYGALAPGAAAVSKSFSFTTSPSATCGGQLVATLRLQDGTTDLGTAAYNFTLGGLTSYSIPDNYSYAGAAVPLPDLTTVEIPITVSATGVISDVNVRMRLTHTANADLDIFLIAPDGTAVELSTDNTGAGYGSGTNDCTGVFTVFDDQATTPITSGAPPFAGTFKPEGLLSALNGKPLSGVWKLRIIDDEGADIGSLGCWQLEISRRIPICCQEGCPSVTRIAPASGPAGTVVTVTGTGFTGATGVKFANNLTAVFTVNSDTQITTTVPVGVATGLVTIIKPNCGDAPAGLFTAPLCPVFSSLDPPANVVGAQVRINGNNFTGVNSVKFSNGVTATFTVTSNNIITATVPAGAITGPIAIGKPDCAEISTSTFTIIPCPAVNAVSPNAAPVGGTVILTGVGFTGVTAVRFNNNSVSATFTINSDTQITATVPTGATTGPITVVRTSCPNATSATFTVQPPPPVPITLSPTVQTIAVGGTGAISVFIPAQTGSTTVSITSSNSAFASAPVTLTIPANASSAQFNVAGNGVGGPFAITATMPASLGGMSASANVLVTARTVRIVSASTAAGGSVTLPVELASQGDENALGFSLAFDQTVLSNPQVALGSDAASAALVTNSTLAAQGRVGIALALPAGQRFAAGSRQIIRVSFAVAANASALFTNVTFGDQPLPREVTDANANVIAAVFTPGVVSLTSGYEADVSPRPNGNGSVTIADWVQIGRFAAGLDRPEPGSELQRADCAPRDTRGDGRVTVADWTQAGRYVSGLDPLTIAGGPTTPVPAIAGSQAANARPTGGVSRRSIRTLVETTSAQSRSVRLLFDAKGDEHAIGLSLLFNPSEWRFVSATAGADASDAIALVNSAEAAEGRVGVALSLPGDRALQAGSRQLIVVNFERLSGAGEPRLALGDSPVAREVVDANARTLSAGASLQLAKPGERSLVNVSAASYAETEFASEQLVAAFGNDLATASASASAMPLPTALAGTSVSITDSLGAEHRASLMFVSPGQVNYQLPPSLAAGVATVTITSGDGTASSALIQIAAAAPSLFTANADGQGVAAAVVLRIRADGTQRYEPVAVFDEALQRFVAAPIDPGSPDDQIYLVLFGSGLGGAQAGITARFHGGGEPVEGPVSYAGRQGGLAGVEQINVRLPHGLAGRGEVEVELAVGSKTSNRVKISVR